MQPIDRPTVQRLIVVSIFGIENDANATYTYTEPVSGIFHDRSDRCDMQINRPTICNFVLDDDASVNGWTITKISPKPENAESLPFENGAYGLSIATYNDHGNHSEVFNYYIHFYNSVTEARFKEDPQEANIPP